MTFTRHLLAALTAVAVIVALGVGLEHSVATSLNGRDRIRSEGQPVTAQPDPAQLREAKAAQFADDRRIDLRLSNTPGLVRTVMLEAAVGGVVLALDAGRRRRRRAARR
jgi:hypothetical protein